MIHNIPQPEFEQIIADELDNNTLVKIRKNHSFVDLEDVGAPTLLLFNTNTRMRH
jgi:2-polyprenyl-6-methoxyphenol hydroxylase-like FAD-dependent oxidoreductase